MQSAWMERHTVRTYEVDFLNRLKASALFDVMQEAASNNAAQLGFGFDDMRERKQFWVLSRAMLRIHSAPGFGEEIVVETWPKGVEKLFAIRDFIFYDSSMVQIGEATTAWLMVNAETLRPSSPESIRHGVNFLEKPPAINEFPGKIIACPETSIAFERRMAYTDIDVNRHVNNVKYVEFALDCLPENMFNAKALSSIRINFLRELKFGDTIQLFTGQFEDGIFYVEGVKPDRTQIFQAVLK